MHINTQRKLIADEIDGQHHLQLWQHLIAGQLEWELVVNGVFIMATYNRLSSEILIRGGLARLSAPAPWSVLIGGLGMGFSAREACLEPRVGRVEVVEIEKAVIAWNRQHLAEVNGGCLLDPRLRVHQGDFFARVTETADRYHLVAMDIDNGPMMLAREGNSRVYGADFFRLVRDRLLPGGIFAVWSCNPAPELLALGREVFLSAGEEIVYEDHAGRQVPYYIYFMGDGQL